MLQIHKQHLRSFYVFVVLENVLFFALPFLSLKMLLQDASRILHHLQPALSLSMKLPLSFHRHCVIQDFTGFNKWDLYFCKGIVPELFHEKPVKA